ncbi:SprT-like domain-containing protein [Pseudoflavonifractor hominis]|uniref:SprT-like domain-containing protein n=1 Tax=Pseudoflavonifractor hominis TaxID=2763059 RepID=A0ABR7HUJ8_9FIRM|nr:SprT-like domain-containing protein [Pseudoflavonifractor hominis]MBC5731218.1 SprT-like domain-containing protein [Pseudoflavonifractor hominis]
MHPFDRLLLQVQQEAHALSIPISAQIVPHVHINTRALTRFGRCSFRDGAYHIELTHRLLDAPERAIRQTLAHELLHTCPGCQNHGPLWQRYAGQMNAAYGYSITRTALPSSLGLADEKLVRHLVVCLSCGREFPRSRASRLTQHPERYRCRCGGKLALRF